MRRPASAGELGDWLAGHVAGSADAQGPAVRRARRLPVRRAGHPGSGSTQPASNAPLSERSIKAAYLYKFAGYVEWPDAPGGAGEDADDRRARVRGDGGRARPHHGGPGDQQPTRPGPEDSNPATRSPACTSCSWVSHDKRTTRVAPAAGPGTSDTDRHGIRRSARDGSVINFTVDRERVRFEVSLPAAVRSRLKLSSRLLAVAQRVQRAPES